MDSIVIWIYYSNNSIFGTSDTNRVIIMSMSLVFYF